MYGAILGDVVGSRFEFDRGPWTKDFEFITERCNWTDDSVMTVAVAEALMNAGKDADVEIIKKECIKSMKKWGQKYPNAGYGARFIHWVLTDEHTPYNSLGNGSAMRVSAVGWLYDSLERTRKVAKATAEVSHNHPEGIKGAECTAAVMFLARTGVNKDEIKEYVTKEFGYDISKTVDEMRPLHRHDETCMDALPKALISFFEGESYEDVVRNAVSLGGDTDTIAAIAGAMAECFFDMPLIRRAECKAAVEDDMAEVMDRFDVLLGRVNEEDDHSDDYIDNAPLDAALMLFLSEEDEDKKTEGFITFLNILAKRVSENARVPMPFCDVNNVLLKGVDIENAMPGDEVKLEEDVRLKMDTMTDSEGKLWIPLFLNNRELNKGKTANIIMPAYIYDILKFGLNWSDIEGVVINPFGRAFTMNKNLLERFLADYEDWASKNGIILPEGPGEEMRREEDIADCGGIEMSKMPMLDEDMIFQVNNATLTEEVFENVAFFMFAEGGAMGEMGCLTWLTDDGSKYHGNYCFGDINLDKVDRLFPVFGKCTFGMFGHGSKVPRGWKYVNLGMGNHLIVNAKYYAEFEEATKDLEDPAEYYQNWQSVADKILGR